MWQQQILRNKQLNNHNKQDKNNQNIMFILRACAYVYRKYSNGQLNKNVICSPACACVHVGKVYWINVSRIGQSKVDKKLTLLTYMCMRVCMYVRDLKYGPFVFLSPHVRFLWSLATTCRVKVVGKRTSHASLFCVECAMLYCCLSSLTLVTEYKS